MGQSLNGLLAKLEAGRAEQVAVVLVSAHHHHVCEAPLDHQTCEELRALAEVFGCESGHLASAILKAALQDIHAGLDKDLDAMAVVASHLIASTR